MATSKNIGIIGMGNMGSGIARNLIKNGFSVTGFDLDADIMKEFAGYGGTAAASVADVGRAADTVFVMVMRGSQAEAVLFGDDGLTTTLPQGGTVIITATFHPREVVEIGRRLDAAGYGLIDSPVSGGYPGAQAGTLTLMASAPDELLVQQRDVLDSISANIHHVGTAAGMGQTVKACLQSLLGSIFSATFEATVLAAKAGVPGQVIRDVFSTAGGGLPIVAGALDKIIDRDFQDGGSHIATMYKDLTISTDMARDLGVPLFTASMAMQLFQAGMTRHPDGDNWVITKLLEEISGAELHR